MEEFPVIVVSGEIAIDPADREAALAATRISVPATRQEDGCLTYGFWADPDDQSRFLVFAEWESLEALHAHFGQPHMAAFLVALGALAVRSSEVHQYDVSDKRPVGT
jgi:quinol monooxygenase YgiN